MGNIDHSFDWKGFYFLTRVVCMVGMLGVLGHYGFIYAKGYIAPHERESVVVQTELPAAAIPPPATLSTTTPVRIINRLSIADAVPPSGKFIAADLVNMRLYLYQDGTTTAEYTILTKGKPGTPYETPSGSYSVLYKEKEHVNAWEHVSMPYSMEFYGNYFIHGWPTYADGTPVASTYSGGCIRLATDDAAQVYAFATQGTKIFVYDPGAATSSPTLTHSTLPVPSLSAQSYLVADIDTGDVYAELNAQTVRPIASVTKLMTALVANETIMFDHKITVPRGKLQDVEVATDTAPEIFVVGDLLYPLLMESNNNIADVLASYYGLRSFVDWMNKEARALDMESTSFADASGVSPDNVSTPEDLYRLAVYLANKKSFVWNITRQPEKTITASDGSRYSFNNFNIFSNLPSFVGGKVGHTTLAQDTMVSVFNTSIDGSTRRIAIIVLGSADYATDTKALADWFDSSAAVSANTACVSCSQPIGPFKKIEL